MASLLNVFEHETNEKLPLGFYTCGQNISVNFFIFIYLP